MNAQTGETLEFFYDPENELFTFTQWHDDPDAPDGKVQHYVKLSARSLAGIAEEVGIASVEYVEDDDENSSG